MEHWTLVDEFNRSAGTTSPRQFESLVSHNVGFYLRTSCAFMRNPAGEFWTPRRLNSARIAPGGLGFAMSKHGCGGEDHIHTAWRGLGDELKLSSVSLTYIGLLRPMLQRALPYFSAIYLIESDGTAPNYNREHFTGGEWLSRQKLEDRLVSGEPAQSLLLPALRLLDIIEGKI